MRTLTFTNRDILNTALVPSDEGEHPYAIETVRSRSGEKITIVSGTSPAASIYWNEHYFVMGSESLPVKSLEHEVWVKGRYTSARAWRWGKYEYEVDYADGGWMVGCMVNSACLLRAERSIQVKDVLSSHPDTAVAYLRSARTHLLHKTEPAQLIVKPDISSEGLAFLLLALIYSEWRRLEVLVSVAQAAHTFVLASIRMLKLCAGRQQKGPASSGTGRRVLLKDTYSPDRKCTTALCRTWLQHRLELSVISMRRMCRTPLEEDLNATPQADATQKTVALRSELYQHGSYEVSYT
ncbi:hypothetical protein GGF50DRAFT_54625 [Schizophyllum commune]